MISKEVVCAKYPSSVPFAIAASPRTLLGRFLDFNRLVMGVNPRIRLYGWREGCWDRSLTSSRLGVRPVHFEG